MNDIKKQMEAAAGQRSTKEIGTVTVACKLPHGMHLDLIDNNGVRVRNTVAGSNSRSVFGGYGLTAGISEDFWNAWVKQNANIDPVKKGFVFAFSSFDSTRQAAEENAELRHGVEPINPDPYAKDKRFPKGIKEAEDAGAL